MYKSLPHHFWEAFCIKKQTNNVRNHIGRLEKTEVLIKMKGYIKRRISGEEKEISVFLRNPTHTNASVAAAASFQNKTVFQGKRIVTTMESQKRPWKTTLRKTWIKWQGGWKENKRNSNKLRLLSMKKQQKRSIW